MAVLERIYNVPLRKEFQKAPMYRRAKKAVIALRAFLMRHMKASDVKLGPALNHAIWARGIKRPPHHVKVTVIRGEDGIAKAELFGVDWADKKAAPPVEEKKAKKAGATHEHVHAEGEEHTHEGHAHTHEAKAEKPTAPKKEAAEKLPAEKKAAPKEKAPVAEKKPAVKKAAKKE